MFDLIRMIKYSSRTDKEKDVKAFDVLSAIFLGTSNPTVVKTEFTAKVLSDKEYKDNWSSSDNDDDMRMKIASELTSLISDKHPNDMSSSLKTMTRIMDDEYVLKKATTIKTDEQVKDLLDYIKMKLL